MHESHRVDEQRDVGGVLARRVAALLVLQDRERLDCAAPARETAGREVAVDAPHVGLAELHDLFAAVRAGDTLVVTKLDRLARSVPEAREIADQLLACEVKLALGLTTHDPTDPMGKMFFNILATFAEFESDLIRMRTREGMAVARAKGKLRGKKPKLSDRQARELRRMHDTIVDASIISAPPSTKNKDWARDPEMHQTKKGNQWFFGMKAHIGVDRRTKVIHAVAASAANVHDATCLGQLLHGEETEVWGDSAYQGQGALIVRHVPNARDMTHRRYRRNGMVDERERAKNWAKSSLRAKVEHPFLVIKRIFGFAKTRYRGLDKNANRLFVACALTNLYLMRGRLLRAT